MLFDEEPAIKSAAPRPRPLDKLSIPELHDYIVRLREEISRVETEITRKEKHRAAADAVFGKKE